MQKYARPVRTVYVPRESLPPGRTGIPERPIRLWQVLLILFISLSTAAVLLALNSNDQSRKEKPYHFVDPERQKLEESARESWQGPPP